ncbi:LysR family transcriptional regulator [Comamonas aquatica]
MRYFECIARHGSITQAAHELCLTQSTVSQKRAYPNFCVNGSDFS